MYGAKITPKEERATKSTTNLSNVIEDITNSLLDYFNANEQKEILLGVKSNLITHNEKIQKEHIDIVEKYNIEIEILNSF